MVLLKIHSDTPYASRAGEFYRRQRDNKEFAYQCECGAKFYIKSNYNAHMLKHSGECPFSCDQCNYEARQKILLDKHRWRCHNIPLPTTRISRRKYRTSLVVWCASKRLVEYTGKIPKHKYTRLADRIELYKTTPILSLLDSQIMTKKEFYSDKSAGYIYDKWHIYIIQCPRRTFPIGNSQRNTEKITDFMNQIHNIHILFPDAFMEELKSLKQDNRKNNKLIQQSIVLYNTIQNKAIL